MRQSRAPFADLIVQKCSAPLIFFYDFYVKSSCGYILVHLLPTSSSQSAPSPTVFYDFYVISSSRCSLVRLLPQTSSSKRALHPTVFYDICETELPLQSCALFKLPRSSRAPAETETLLRQPRQPLYPKERRVSRPTVFSSLNSRDPDLLHFPTT